jgi:hypothetical protein
MISLARNVKEMRCKGIFGSGFTREEALKLD